MNEDYAAFEVVVKEDGSVRIKELGETPEHCDCIDNALKSIERRLMNIRNDMHFEDEHDPNEGPEEG